MNFTKLQKEMDKDWTWLSKHKAAQPPSRDKNGKIKIISDIKNLTSEDIHTMSQAQLIASWRLSTGILNSKMELLTARIQTTDSLLKKYQTESRAKIPSKNKLNIPESLNIDEKIQMLQDQVNHLSNLMQTDRQTQDKGNINQTKDPL